LVSFAAFGPQFGTKLTKGMTNLADVFKIIVRVVEGQFVDVKPFDGVKINEKGFLSQRNYGI
jgi:hypothetical protein